LEVGLFNNRLNATVEYFNRDSKDLLQSVPISTVTGFSSTLRNIGEINNHGVEIELSGDIIRTNDLTWSAGITGSWIKSTVTSSTAVTILSGTTPTPVTAVPNLFTAKANLP